MSSDVRMVTVQGATPAEATKRLAAMEKLNELDTTVLTRMAELSDNPKAQSYFKSGILFEVVKGFLLK